MAVNFTSFIWNMPPGKWAVKKTFVGKWRITELQDYDADYVDMCGPAMLTIGSRGSGRINFGASEAEIDCRMDDFDERVVRFSFEGSDEGDPICGHGYCLVAGDELHGRIFRHLSDTFGFKARRIPKEERG
jgi:hypothetical protein